MCKSLPSGKFAAAALATIILWPASNMQSFTITGLLQQSGTSKCAACIQKLVSGLENINNVFADIYKTGTITEKKPNLFDQLADNHPNLVKCDCKHNCKYFSIYKQAIDSAKEFSKREDLRKAYSTVYWYGRCNFGLRVLSAGLNKLNFVDRAKYVSVVKDDIKQFEKVVISPDLKNELKLKKCFVTSAINELKKMGQEEFSKKA